jgi:hypothetical protein
VPVHVGLVAVLGVSVLRVAGSAKELQCCQTGKNDLATPVHATRGVLPEVEHFA